MSASSWAFANGEIVPLEQARYWPNDLAIIYGDLVYEATRTFRGEPFRLQAHVERLYRSLRYTHIDPGLSPEELTAASLDVVAKNRPDLPDGSDMWIFHNITRGSHPDFMDIGRGDAGATVLIWTHELGFKGWASKYADGAHCVIPSVRQMDIATQDPRMKTRSRMFFALAEQEAHALDPAAHALLLDGKGHIAEASGANFMLVQDGTILTPRSGTGLSGVSLGTIHDLCNDLGIEIREADLTLYDVYTADEALLSSTPFCVLPVTRVNGANVADGRPGDMFARLIDTWSETVGIDIVEQARKQAQPKPT